MASSSRRIVITGAGIVCPIGLTKEAVWQSFVDQKGGIRVIDSFDSSTLPLRLAGTIPSFDAKQYVDKKERKSLKVMSRTIQLAVAAAQLAMDDSGAKSESLDPARFGVEFGAGLISSELEDLGAASHLSCAGHPGKVNLETWGTKGLANMQPLWMLRYLPNMLACHVSIFHNAQGPNNTITENEVAGLLAIGEARRVMQRNLADFFLVGGADCKLNPLTLVRHSLFMPLSRRNEEPDKASRPFDRDRDGFVMGEGAGVLAIEELAHARKRGARIYAEIAGFGAAYDRGRTGAGLARAIRAALAQAGVSPADIDHVNAQGFGAIETDIWEARGIHEVFGAVEPAVPVFAAKSYVGSMGAGSGPAELIFSLLAMEKGLLPASLNYDNPDPRCPVAVHASGMRPVAKPHMLKVSFTEMGQCAALVLRKW